MKAITKFDKKNANALQDELLVVVAEWAKKHGLEAVKAGGRIGETEFVANFALRITDTEALEASERATFDKYCRLFQLEPKHFGAQVVLNGKPHTLCGLAINRSKFPLKFKDAQGKVTLFTDIAAAKVRESVK